MNEISKMEQRLQGEFDASVWAREFVATVAEHPDVPTSEGAMLGWFANAIMAGYDRGREHERAQDINPTTERP